MLSSHRHQVHHYSRLNAKNSINNIGIYVLYSFLQTKGIYMPLRHSVSFCSGLSKRGRGQADERDGCYG
jgi:hypothetical protein